MEARIPFLTIVPFLANCYIYPSKDGRDQIELHQQSWCRSEISIFRGITETFIAWLIVFFLRKRCYTSLPDRERATIASTGEYPLAPLLCCVDVHIF